MREKDDGQNRRLEKRYKKSIKKEPRAKFQDT
jgi:hypothetical protein